MSRRSLNNFGVQVDAVGRCEEAKAARAETVSLNAGIDKNTNAAAAWACW